MIFLSQRDLADRFVLKHHPVYGLNGSNTTKNPGADFPSARKDRSLHFSVNDHFKFGYNGDVFNFRDSSTCMYWAEYDVPRRPIHSIAREMTSAAEELLNLSKNPAFVYTGSPYSRAVLSALSLTLKPFRVVLPRNESFKGLEAALSEDLSKFSANKCAVEPRDFTWSNFEIFLDRYAVEIRGVDPLIAFSIFLNPTGDAEFIYEAHGPRVRDQNWDRGRGHSIGPVNWCLEDRESDTEAARYLMVHRVGGWPNFFWTTPEIYPSIFRDHVSQAGARDIGPDGPSLEVSVLASFGLGAECPPAWASLSQHLASFESRLEARSPKAREVWLMPVDRLMARWKLEPFDANSKNEEVYGSVL